MLETDGFWSAISNLIFWGGLLFLGWKFLPDLRSLLRNRDIDLEVAGNKISVQRATHKIGEDVAELQARIAHLEEAISRSDQSTGQEMKPHHELEKTHLEPERAGMEGRRRILWVDDFPSNNAFIVENLKGRDFEVDIKLNTEDAVKIFTALDHQLIITDLGRMENGIDNPLAGLDLISAIRRVNAEVPIIVFAGKRGVAMREELIGAGASAVTASGIDVMKLIDRYMG